MNRFTKKASQKTTMEWETIETYFQSQGIPKLVEHQIESFEDFIRNKIPLIVASTAPIVVWHEQDEKLKKYNMNCVLDLRM